MDEITATPLKPAGPDFGAYGENTVRTDKVGPEMNVKWNVEDLLADDKQKSLLVRC